MKKKEKLSKLIKVHQELWHSSEDVTQANIFEGEIEDEGISAALQKLWYGEDKIERHEQGGGAESQEDQIEHVHGYKFNWTWGRWRCKAMGSFHG